MEGARITVPSTAGRLTQKVRRVGAEQGMRFHCQAGHAAPRTLKCGDEVALARNDVRPEFQLLRRIENHTVIARVLFPSGRNESGPGVNRWCGPCCGAIRTATTVIRQLHGAGGAIAGSDDDASVDDPSIYLQLNKVFWSHAWYGRPHGWIIRCWTFCRH